MKTNLILSRTDVIILVILAIFFILGIRVVISFFRPAKTPLPETGSGKQKNRNTAGPRKVTVSIDGMMCGMCEAHIKDAIRKGIPDATHITASHTSGKVSFTVEEDITEDHLLQKLHEQIDPLGYRIAGMETKAA